MHKCQSVCVADMVSMLVTFTKWQQTCILLRSQDFRVWTGSDEARRAGRSLANVADSLLPNFQLVVWPPSQPDLGGSSRERKTIRANWDSFPHILKLFPNVKRIVLLEMSVEMETEMRDIYFSKPH